MSQKAPEPTPKQDSKVVFVRTKGSLTERWRKMLREEGGTESHHSWSALDEYITRKGY